MHRLNLAIISDIHAGDKARAKDLCPPKSEARDKKLDDNYQEKFLTFLAAQRPPIQADYLVLPGDVTHSADPDEVEIASSFIAEAAAALDVKAGNVVFVPGNHDVDWRVLRLPDSTGVRRRQRFGPLKDQQFAFEKIIEAGEGSVFDAPHFTIWDNEDILVVGYNSAHHDQPETKLHHGLVDLTHMQQMRDALARVPRITDKLRLFLIHHHPVQYDDPTPDSPDASIMVNAEHLQALLREFRFDILVHGHKHLPRFGTYSLNGAPEIAILCSGSFSVEIDTRWNGSVSNQFHLVTVEGRDPEEHLITGQVTSWSYNFARGWTASNAVYDGIPHVEPFGTYTRHESLRTSLLPVLTAKLEAERFVEWRSITALYPHFKHLRPEAVHRVLDELAPVCGFRRVYDAPHRIVLLKESAT